MRVRTLLAVAATAAPFLLAPPAGAVPPVALSVHGYGQYFPGYGIVPTPQSMHVTGTATDLVTGVVHACWWDMRGLADTVANGVGTWEGTCGPYVFAACVYSRGGTAANVACPSGWSGQLVWVVDLNSAYEFTVDGVVATP